MKNPWNTSYVGLRALPIILCSAALGFAAAPTSLNAQIKVEEVPISSKASYKQESSGISLPPTLGDYTRESVTRFGTANDVGARYIDEATGSWASVYLSRVATPDASLMFDNVRRRVTKTQGLARSDGDKTQAKMVTVPGFERPAAWQVSYPVSGGSAKSSGLSVLAIGDFIIKLRVSSETLSPEQLDGVLTELMNSIDLPKPSGAEPPLYEVKACPDKIRFASKPKLVKNDDEFDGAISGLLGSVLGVSPDLQEAKDVPQYCIDAASNELIGLYRPGASKENYLALTDDTGRSISVGIDLLPELIAKAENKSSKTAYTPRLNLPDETLVLRAYNGLPSPDIVLKNFNSKNITGSTDRNGTVSINAPEG